MAYDAAGQVTQRVYPGGPVLNFGYDGAGRLTAAEHLALQYDARGAVTNGADGAAAYGAAYDAGGRLAAVRYDGEGTVTYTYDRLDLLVRAEDDRSGAWVEFVYDADRRLERIERANGVATIFTRDAAGRVVRIQDGSLGDQQYTLNAEGEPVGVVRTLPLDTPLTGAVRSLTYDAAAQVASAGYAYDARGRRTAAPGMTLSYDGASRLTAITSGAESVVMEYNGLGDVRSRAAGGLVTHYTHHYAIRRSPVVAEKRDDVYRRFYVYTPGGELLYGWDAATAAPFYYHYDSTGTTLFLTDATGAVTDAYAHDPYGHRLGRTGASDQPFTYMGKYGVRCEPVGGLYDMRARWYDPVSAAFLTRDPLWPDLGDVAALNPYPYAAQNPLRYIDPEGLDEEEDRQKAEWFIRMSQEYGATYDKETGHYTFSVAYRWTPDRDHYSGDLTPAQRRYVEEGLKREEEESEASDKAYREEWAALRKGQQEALEQEKQQKQRIREGYRKMMWTICRLNGPTIQAMAAEAPGGGMSVDAFCRSIEQDEMWDYYVELWGARVNWSAAGSRQEAGR